MSPHGPRADIFTGSRSRGRDKAHSSAQNTGDIFCQLALQSISTVDECWSDLKKVPNYIIVPMIEY